MCDIRGFRAFCIGRDQHGEMFADAVRISSNGNLVSAESKGHAHIYGRDGDRRSWPPTYPTWSACEEAIAAIQAKCRHQWRPTSHEASRCVSCGMAKLLPDLK